MKSSYATNYVDPNKTKSNVVYYVPVRPIWTPQYFKNSRIRVGTLG